MPASVRLDERTERMLRRLTVKTGRTRSEVMIEAIRRLADAQAPERPGRTFRDRLSHLIGIGNSGGSRLSENTGAKFRAMLVARRRSS